MIFFFFAMFSMPSVEDRIFKYFGYILALGFGSKCMMYRLPNPQYKFSDEFTKLT